MADGVVLKLENLDEAAESAAALQVALRELNSTGVPAEVAAELDPRSDKPILRISRRHHGNIKSSVITQEFVHGADYAALATAADTFRGADRRRRQGPARRGRAPEGERVADFAARCSG